VLLEDKNAVIYGAGGSVGGAIARAFAGVGARVFLAGRTAETLDRVAGEIAATGGAAETARVDALDEQAVDNHAEAVVQQAGSIDVSFNATTHGDVHGTPLIEMSVDDFIRPMASSMKSQFLTARAAARHMVRRGSGVIMAITATTGRIVVPEVGSTGVTFDAMESLCRQWARELGPSGVRVVWLHTTGIPDALHADRFPGYGTGTSMTRDQLVAWMQANTMLNRLTSLEDVGNVAAFLASDRASAMTASGVNVSVGSAPTR
jgi:3-oxoacyl-[acyl-carrier protein] reductase